MRTIAGLIFLVTVVVILLSSCNHQPKGKMKAGEEVAPPIGYTMMCYNKDQCNLDWCKSCP